MSKPVDYAALTQKRCSKCKKVKPVAEFNRYDDPKAVLTGWRYYSWCRACSNTRASEYGKANRGRRNERLREWRKTNPEAARAKDRRARLKRKYGLTEEQVEALWSVHDGQCWLCLVRPAVAIDHDHETGHVRGMTCAGCNSIVLARADADPLFLARVAAYQAAGHHETYVGSTCHADLLLTIANTPDTKEAP